MHSLTGWHHCNLGILGIEQVLSMLIQQRLDHLNFTSGVVDGQVP